jgi:cyclic pyranopterin phosphate synthase
MPEEEYVWLARQDLLRFEEIRDLVAIFTGLGVDRVRLTGGEPLLRRGLVGLVGMLSQNPGVKDLAMTTNGVLLADQAQGLYDAGLHRVTVSLDTLQPDRFRRLTRRDAHAEVLEGIAAAIRVGFRVLKIDTVVMRGVNDDEMDDLLEYGRRIGAEVRFIEYMDVGGATRWSEDQVVSRAEMLERLQRRYGELQPVIEERSAPAERFQLRDGTTFGIIGSTTSPFCKTCDRARLTADGMWYLCLYATEGVNLREPLRAGEARGAIESLIVSGWKQRKDRGAEERQEMASRRPLVPVEGLRSDPHLEMHTRGG